MPYDTAPTHPQMSATTAPAPRPARPTIPADIAANANPHCRQLNCQSVRALQGDCVSVVPLGELPWVLREDSPQTQFVDRPDDERSPLHFGQLKLLLSMLTFLLWHTEASEGVDYCLFYAGAAPGNSAAYIARLFPRITFYLFDPAPFCAELASPPANVRTFNDYFTDETAAAISERFVGRRTLFVSDIRTGKTSDCVRADMAAQQAWARAIGAESTMMKFRLPWEAGQTLYLAGLVTLQAFAPLTSTETRLISTRRDLYLPARAYDHGAYERQLAHHNMLGRVQYHDHTVNAAGLDHCYDCAVLVLVGKELLRRTTGAHTDQSTSEWIVATIAALKAGRTLDSTYAVSSTRREPQGGPRRGRRGPKPGRSRGSPSERRDS